MNNLGVIDFASLVDGWYILHLDSAFASSLLSFSVETSSFTPKQYAY